MKNAVASVTLGEHEDFGFDAGMCEASTWSMFSSFSTRYCSCNIEEHKLTAWKTRKDYDENKAAAKVEVLSVATLIVKEKAKAEAEIQREMVRLLQEREEGRKALVHEERRNREISTRLERAKEEKHDHELSSQKQMTETLEQLHQAQANERRLGQRCATPRAPALFLYCIELFMCAGLRVWRVSCGQR